ncbi:MAG: hypothetical protein ABJB17_05585, partial [Burkholderiales bacterium]
RCVVGGCIVQRPAGGGVDNRLGGLPSWEASLMKLGWRCSIGRRFVYRNGYGSSFSAAVQTECSGSAHECNATDLEHKVWVDLDCLKGADRES